MVKAGSKKTKAGSKKTKTGSKKTKAGSKKANTGKEYEMFVADLQQAILDSEEYMKQNNLTVDMRQKNIIVERNKKIVDSNGLKRQFDIYWEYELEGVTYKKIVECKDYKDTISIEKIDALLGKLQDIPGVSGIFATKTGYESGAEIKARNHGIELLIVRKQNDSDWIDKDGNQLLKSIYIDISGTFPALIHSFQPYYDSDWIKESGITEQIRIIDSNSEIFINDVEKNEKYSILDLSNKLSDLEKDKPGTYEKEFVFSNAYLESKDINVKITGYKVKYSIREPLKDEIDIDYSNMLLGVIEYLLKGMKKKIFKNGNVKEEKN